MTKTTLSPFKSGYTRLIRIFKALQDIDRDFPIQYALCMLEIADNEGMAISALSAKTGIPLSTISRIVGALSDNRQKGKPFDLLFIRTSDTSRRTKEIYLSPRGHDFVKNLIEASQKPL